MTTILWIEWTGFYASHFPSSERDLIVTRDRKVLDANESAVQKGVVPHMEIRQAKTLAQGSIVKEWERDRFIEQRNRWLDLCTRYSGQIEPIDQHIAAIDLSTHPNPIDITERLIRDLLAEFHWTLKYGLAPSKWIAFLSADRNDFGSALRDPCSFVSRLPVTDLLPVSSETRERLRFLGYPTIGDVAKIPLRTLQDQFGEEGLVISSASCGAIADPVVPLYPPDSIHDSFYFQAPVDEWDSVRQALAAIGNRLGRKLLEKEVHGSILSLTIEMEEATPIELKRKFTKPFQNPLSVLAGFEILFNTILNESRSRSSEASEDALVHQRFTGIRASLSELKRGKYLQTKLNGFHAFGEERPEAESALNYVKTVFGNGAVKLAREIESPRRMRVLKEWQHATGWR